MKDKSWKPKRVGADSSGIPSDVPVIEISIRSTECKVALEAIIREMDGVRLKESQDHGVSALMIMELEENPEDTFSLIREMMRLNKGMEIFLTTSQLESKILLDAMNKLNLNQATCLTRNYLSLAESSFFWLFKTLIFNPSLPLSSASFSSLKNIKTLKFLITNNNYSAIVLDGLHPASLLIKCPNKIPLIYRAHNV